MRLGLGLGLGQVEVSRDGVCVSGRRLPICVRLLIRVLCMLHVNQTCSSNAAAASAPTSSGSCAFAAATSAESSAPLVDSATRVT